MLWHVSPEAIKMQRNLTFLDLAYDPVHDFGLKMLILFETINRLKVFETRNLVENSLVYLNG